jgi:uncharacterized protein YndB with AHSA1/START domain
MSVQTTAIEVTAPPEEVFAYVTDPAKFGEWQANVSGGHLEGQDAPRVGARCVTTRRIGLAERRVTSEITHVDPPRRWGVRGVDGPIRATVNVVVDPIDGGKGSRVEISIDFQGHGIGKLLVPLIIERQAKREMPANVKRLKDRVEESAKNRPPR